MHIAYTVQAAFHLPLRIYRYKKRMWHYFLFDLCYYVTILNFVYIWILPQSPALFVACYCLSHGSVASAVITWRNSLVFHDSDKNTSLFVHMYPPLVFTVIRCVCSVLFLDSGRLSSHRCTGIIILAQRSVSLHSRNSRILTHGKPFYCLA